MSTMYARERTLQDEIAPAVEPACPASRCWRSSCSRRAGSASTSTIADGVDHALCERVTRALDAVPRPTTRSTCRHPGRSVRCASPSTSPSRVGTPRRVRLDGGEAEPLSRRADRAGDDAITLEAGDAREIRIPYDAIVRANLIDEGLTT